MIRWAEIITLLLFGWLLTPKPVQAAVLINEVSPASDPEWVELYNSGSDVVDISNWSLVDESGKIMVLTAIIPATGLVVFDHASGWLNNSVGQGKDYADILTLFNNASPAAQIDQVKFGAIAKEKSYSRIPDGGNWLTSVQSKGLANTPPTPTAISSPTATATNTPTATPNPTSTPVNVSQITQAPTTKPTAKPKSKLTPTSTASPSAVIASNSGLVLGEEITSPSITEPIASESSSTKPRFSSRILGFGAIAAGVILFLTAAVVAFKLK